MTDITKYKLVDIFTGKMLRYNTAEEVSVWLTDSYVTLTEQQVRMIDQLELSFKQGDEDGILWYGAACALDITPRKRTRSKRK